MSAKPITRRKALISIGAATTSFVATLLSVPYLVDKYSDREHGEYREFSTHPVDQVFRDNTGYRVRWVGEDDVSEEVKYSILKYPQPVHERGVSGGMEGMPQDISYKFRFIGTRGKEQSVILIHDLEDGERGYANVLHYEQIVAGGEDKKDIYVEIHLRRNQGISPGHDIDTILTSTEQMHEIR